MNGLSSGEGLIWAVRDAITKHVAIKEHGRVVGHDDVIEDQGITDKRLLVFESEFSSTLRVMGRDGSTLSTIIRQAWDGQDLRILTKNSPARATAPHISIIGHITRDELRRDLAPIETSNGFGNRFLWVCAKRSTELPDGGAPVDLSALIEIVRNVVLHAREVREMGRDRDSKALWNQVYGSLSAARPGLLGTMTARAEAQVMRLACLYALGDMSYVVRLPHLRAGLAVWKYCFDSASYLFGQQLGDATADEILRALRKEWPASLTRSFISRELFSRNKPATEISRALELLKDNGLARHEDDHSGEGRPAERWFALPGDDIGDKNDVSGAAALGSVVNVVNVVGAEQVA